MSTSTLSTAAVSDLIDFIDPAGRRQQLPREAFAATVLPDQLRRHWDQPAALHADVVFAIENGLAPAVVVAAERLQQIDLTDPQRAALALAGVLLQLQRFADARAVLERFISLHGERGPVLTLLSRALAALGETDDAQRLLRKGLVLDPNQSDGLALYAQINRQQFGPAGYRAALEEISEEPRAWRPQLMLAHELLREDPQQALELYSQTLANLAQPDPGVLAMISGDLLGAGLAQQAVELVKPAYNPQRDSPRTAVNLVKALRQLGREDEAAEFARWAVQQRPDLAALLG